MGTNKKTYMWAVYNMRTGKYFKKTWKTLGHLKLALKNGSLMYVARDPLYYEVHKMEMIAVDAQPLLLYTGKQ